MGCPETRKQLSSYADGALGAEEREQVASHLAQCYGCRRELDEQGALDMLLKKHYDAAPPPGFMDGFWPQVEQRIEDEAGGGGGGQDEEIVFKASPALKMLNIPDRKPPEPEPVAEAAAPVAPPPQQQTSYRWPVAFVLAVGVATAGILIHKKMMPPAQPPVERTGAITSAAQATAPETDEAAASQPAAAGGAMVVASAAGSEGKAVGEPGEEPGDDPTAAATKGHPRRSARPARRRAKGAEPGKPAESKPEDKPAAEVAAAPTPKPTPGKKTDLDSLIDDAIGKKPAAAAPAKAAPAAAPKSDLPDQLTMNDIRVGMGKIKNSVQACYDKFQIEGKATVRLTITREGAVSAAAVKGKFFGTDTGTCVVTAVKKASFPKFSGKEMTITYPFILQ